MKPMLLTDLPVKHLEYVFSPPGLPLPVKGESEQGTTSILVRGGPGAGKTTFALALAHAIAKAGGGLVLYLTTEFSPVEIAFKATLIGLPEEVVDVWPGAASLVAGNVVVEHLSVVRQGRPVLSSAERKRGAIDAVWGLLHPEKENEKRPPLPVRAVVIDALTLPEAGESEGALRADLVAFVQALENEGISVVLVEELAAVAAAWSSFVVDVVFELSFQPDPETHDLRRKLTVSKCRYALSIPGPHDYGLESGVPGVWPDLLRIVSGPHGKSGTPQVARNAPTICVPMTSEESWASFGASVVLSPYDKTQGRAVRALQHTPGFAWVDVNCGARTAIRTPSHGMEADDHEGPYAIGWCILAVAAQGRANACLFQNLDGLLSWPGWTVPVIHLLEGLRLMGFMVCVHSPSAAIQSLDAMTDLAWGPGKHRPVTLTRRRHRALARLCVGTPWLKDNIPYAQQLAQIDGATNLQLLQAAREMIDSEAAATAPLPNTLKKLQLTTLYERSGGKIDDARRADLLNAGGKEGQQAAWLALLTSADWHAARAALAAVESDKPDATMLLLWKAVCAAIAKNLAAIDELKALLTSPDESLILDPLLRGLGRTDQLDEADGIIDEVGKRHSLAPWMLERLRADIRLESDERPILLDAMVRLITLTVDESIPLVHRAEIWHNLGTAQDRLGQRDAAIASFEHASALNPFLDAARDEIERLRSPQPSSPS
jgi:KaiC/GvpD/RAD55 family RecA-like ATPase/tetratricopeptide (TPR) repeat protein